MRQWTTVCRYIEIDRRWQRGEQQKSIAYSKKITQGRVWQILRRVEKIKDCMIGLSYMQTDAFDVLTETEACRDQCFSFELWHDGGMMVNYGRDNAWRH
jgi:hypothetical protein